MTVLTQPEAGHLAIGKVLLEAGEWGKPSAWGLPRRFVKRNRQTPTSRICMYPKKSREGALGWSQERSQVWGLGGRSWDGAGAGTGFGQNQG